MTDRRSRLKSPATLRETLFSRPGRKEMLGGGLEPPCLSACAPQTHVSAISPPERGWGELHSIRRRPRKGCVFAESLRDRRTAGGPGPAFRNPESPPVFSAPTFTLSQSPHPDLKIRRVTPLSDHDFQICHPLAAADCHVRPGAVPRQLRDRRTKEGG